MKIKINTKLGIITILTLILSFSGSTFAADDDSPPSLDYEQPPSIVIEAPDDDDDNPNQPPQDEDDLKDDDANPDQPPQDDDDDAVSTVKITNVSVKPQKFNPTINETKISYRLSKLAKMEIKILDSKNATVATLLNNQNQDAGNHSVNWYGTKNNVKGGQTVAPGIYNFKITAKNASSSATEDTKQGQMEILGASSGTNQNPTGNTGTTTQNNATVALNNTRSGQTSETGPGILLYPLIPVAAYLVRRTLRK